MVPPAGRKNGAKPCGPMYMPTIELPLVTSKAKDGEPRLANVSVTPPWEIATVPTPPTCVQPES